MKRDLLEDVKIIIPEIFSDERGNFSENFNQKNFKKLRIMITLLFKIIRVFQKKAS